MSQMFKNKNVLLVAGLLVGLVTLFSHSLRVEIKPTKAATEQQADSEQQVFVIAPSDAVTVNAFSFEVDLFTAVSPVFQQVEKSSKAIPVFCERATAFFQTLFRYIISPNAP